jgi:hypothetical protein
MKNTAKQVNEIKVLSYTHLVRLINTHYDHGKIEYRFHQNEVAR